MPYAATVPSTYRADLEAAAATVYHTLADAGLTREGDACTSAATAGSPRSASKPVVAVAHDAMGLLIGGSTVTLAYQIRGELGRGQYGCVYLIEECVQHHLLALKATYGPIRAGAAPERQRLQARRRQQQQQKSPKDSGGDAHDAALASCAPLEEDDCAAPFRASLSHISNEAMCLRECHSPFIVRLEGAGRGENGEDLLLMEYVDGGDLRREIRRRTAKATPFTETEAVFVFLQLCMAVDHLHHLNMLHHDLKPENVMLSQAGIVKLGDFGFAKKYREPVCQRVASTGCGTPYYLSPEALRGDRYSLKSDMWALGIILYELLALAGPFAAATRAELRTKANNSDYPALPGIYSDDLRSVCYQLLTVDPDQRPSTRDLFDGNEYLRDKLNALRRISECSVNMSTEEKGSMFHCIRAALRRRQPASPKVAATALNLGWGGSCKSTSHDQGSRRPATASAPRVVAGGDAAGRTARRVC
ncbi:hypothetical protein LSCM1_00237 [Leishmania martiniquensis]|uniref:non-specific serine/threonine protein kinase n=1 Tax=Leishmania martiniquensis TaxID=1580590 RepID=A0A836GBK9_9TRYP|nr:hypothetical protein LSCM1_00237 [Leishmania martiniquensis]